MTAIIVDDEPKAIELLRGYLEHFRTVKLVGTFRNGLKAFEFMAQEPVDLVLLDINMPHISGLSLAKMIDPATRVIFTTAYSEFAVESYEVQAVDYLLKPISLARFTQAMGKVLTPAKNEPPATPDAVLWVKSGSKNFQIHAADIHYLEKAGNYLTYHLATQKILARESVGEALANLPAYFVQTHKSFIVNTRQVTSMDKEAIQAGQATIPIGAAFKAQLRDWFKG